MDTAPVAYLMTDAKICAPSTWGIMQYVFGGNNPEIMYRYFKMMEKIPDSIIYIYWRRDLSIEDNNFKFNDFVNENYDLSEETEIGDTFRVLVYLKE